MTESRNEPLFTIAALYDREMGILMGFMEPERNSNISIDISEWLPKQTLEFVVVPVRVKEDAARQIYIPSILQSAHEKSWREYLRYVITLVKTRLCKDRR